MEKTIKRYWPVFVLPTLAAFIIGFIWPFLQGLYLSFCKFITIDKAGFNGLKNYAFALTEADFLHAFWFTALFTVVSTVCINLAALAIALALTREIRGTNLFRSVFFMPNLIGGIVLGYIWNILLNCALTLLGKPLMSLHAPYGFAGLIILMCWQQIGYMTIIYIAGLQSIPNDYLEAARFPNIQFIAEDLGYLTPEVQKLLRDSGFPGMKVLEFAFDSREPSNYLPHTYTPHCVCYAGTHDNATLVGWKDEAAPDDIAMARRYLGLNEEEGFHWGVLRGGMSSVSQLFVAQMQDYLGLGSAARMNTPGTLGGNWQWRMLPGQITEELTKRIADMTALYGRSAETWQM